jgi:Tol biopolymer transport system component
MGSPDPSFLSLGHLLRAGVSLYTREAAAVVAEICRQVFYFEEPIAPVADAILLGSDGSLRVCSADSVTANEQMTALASLLETLLPPLGSSEPDYIVRASLRMLAPRARGRPGLAPIPGPEGLAAELSPHATSDPTGVLRELWTRGDRALHRYLAPTHSEEHLTAAAVRREAATRQSRVGVIGQNVSATRVSDGELDPSTVATNPPRWLRASVIPLAAAALVAIGFPGGVWLGKHSYEYSHHARPAADKDYSAAPPAASSSALAGPSAGSGTVLAEPSGSPKTDAAATVPAPLQMPGVRGPTFSPSFAGNGREILFHVGREPVSQIAQARLATGARAESVAVLSDDRARTYHARLSPDGQFVAFDSDRDGERAVYIARRDWSQATKVSGAGMAALPSWSPNMKWLAMVRAEPDRPRVWNLWLREMRTGAVTRLTNYRFGQTWNASWFPDSTLICYSHEDRLIVFDITTRAARVFESPRRGHLVRTPAVSPDGTRVIFQVHKDGVWLLDLTNGSSRRLLDDPSAEEFAWDPAGTRVAYHSRRDGAWRIWLMAAPAA